MRKMTAILLISSLFGTSACQQKSNAEQAHAKTSLFSATTDSPVVVELYQSQGCSSCPPANAALNMIADRPGVIALSFAVTYWDRLGWKDIFADESYTQRQYDYARTLGNANVYTPQVVINGKEQLTGIKRGELARAVQASTPLSGGPQIAVNGNIVIIGKKPENAVRADIWLVRFDPRTQHVGIRSGENSGRTLPHKNIVKSLVRLGHWQGKSARYGLPRSADTNWKSAILVQRQTTGEIIAAKII